MRTVKTETLVPGMVLARDVYDRNGLLIIGAGSILTYDYLTKLNNWNIVEVAIEELTTSLKDQQEEAVSAQIAVVHDRAVEVAENVLVETESENIDLALLHGMVDDLNNQIELSSNVLLSLSHLKNHGNYLYSHSVNVCVLALLIGKSLKFSAVKLRELGVTALLHDYGMIQLDPLVYDHPHKLTDEQWTQVKRHPHFGRETLASSGKFSEAILSGIMDHHERCDGSGYPAGKNDKAISEFGKIIGIADVYDACISPRKYRPRIIPHQALKNLLGQSSLFDVTILKSFLSVMAIYPIGSIVRLNSGEIAKVVGINPGQPFRPDIRIVLDRMNQILHPPVRINLLDQEYTQTYIMEILDGENLEDVERRLDQM